MTSHVIISLIIGSVFAIIVYWVIEKIRNKTKVFQRLEPQEDNLMKIFTEVYYNGDLIKKWDFNCKFSKVKKRAKEEYDEGRALIKLYKKFRS